VAYRGYFREDRAQRFATSLEEDGKDVYVAGVTAYSTLGNFDDPVLSTMLYWDDHRLAGLIFHELAHQVLYVKGDTDFSESFASFVEEEGVRRWLVSEGRADDVPEYEASRARLAAFGELVVRTRERLRTIYKAGYAESELGERKRIAFEDMRQEYREMRAGWGDVLAFDAWFERDLNNAHLASVAAYRRFVPAFAALLRQQAGDLDRFYRAVEEIAAKELPGRHRLLLELIDDKPGGPEPIERL
jgi:predicted aminopeptidase